MLVAGDQGAVGGNLGTVLSFTRYSQLHPEDSTARCTHLALFGEGAAAGIKGDPRRHEARGHGVARLGGEVGKDIHVCSGVHPPRHAALWAGEAVEEARGGVGWARACRQHAGARCPRAPAALLQRLPPALPRVALTCRQPLASSPTSDSCMFCIVTVSA